MNKEHPETYEEPQIQIREKRELPPEKRVAIGPLSEKLKERFIDRNELTRTFIEKDILDSGLSAEQYFDNFYFSAKFGGKEYFLTKSEPTGDHEDWKVQTIYRTEGPQTLIDNDIPRKFWDILRVHEITEIEEKKKEKKTGKVFSPLEYEEHAKRMQAKRHALALIAEEGYARNTRTSGEFEEYSKWAKEFREKYAQQ